MGEWLNWSGDPPQVQHARLVALRQLIANGIPCILWGEDALAFAHLVPTGLFDQQILVPDELLDAAAAILEQPEGKYQRTPEPHPNYVDRCFDKGEYVFPRSIRLEHIYIPENDPYKLDPIPRNILLLPQSYFALNTRSTSRFQSLVPPLDSSNAGILVPKYNTFLGGLIHFVMYPPKENETFPTAHHVFIDYLLRYRIKHPCLPIGRKIMSEIQTSDCAWYMRTWFFRKKSPGVGEGDREEYKRQKELRKGEFNTKGGIGNGAFKIRCQTTYRSSSSPWSFKKYTNRPSANLQRTSLDRQPLSTSRWHASNVYSSQHHLSLRPSVQVTSLLRTLSTTQRLIRLRC